MKVSQAVMKTDIDGEIVLMNVDSGAFFALKGTAAAIWVRMEAGVARESMVSSLKSEYDLDEALAQRHVDDLLEELRKVGLIEV